MAALGDPAGSDYGPAVRAQLLHLSGPLRGRTATYEARVVRIGTGADVEARVDAPNVAARHAAIEFVQEECQFYLRKQEGQVFVNGNEVEEVILQDGDQLELGTGGPRLRFRIYVPIGAVCKPVRRMLADARDVARVSGGAVATQTLTRDLLTQATWKLKVGVPLAVLCGAFLAGWLGGLLGRPRQQSDMVTRAELDQLKSQQQRMQELQQTPPVDAVSHAEIEELRKAQRAQQEELARLARANATLRQIQREWSRGVCLLHGAFRLRLPDGTWLEADAEPFEVEYTGSGFLVTAEGHVVTNRHVAVPWLEMDRVMELVQRGASPEFVRLTATFPDHAPIDVPAATIQRRPDSLDIAVLQLPKPAIEGVPVLPLHTGAIDGDDQRAIVVGYPTGLAALLARADNALVSTLQQRKASMAEAIAELAATRQIAPVITQGVLSNIQEHVIAHDAPTTHGGSGGPVFGGSGTVIAVTNAILREFVGNNQAVPIRYAQELLPNQAALGEGAPK
jgi:serine protease Do